MGYLRAKGIEDIFAILLPLGLRNLGKPLYPRSLNKVYRLKKEPYSILGVD
jgi:hypothetical protein